MAHRDRALRRAAGVNGNLEKIATQAMRREGVRVVKHSLLAASVIVSVLGHPQPWLAAIVCLMLSGTSIMDLRFRRSMESRLKRDQAKLREATA